MLRYYYVVPAKYNKQGLHKTKCFYEVIRSDLNFYGFCHTSYSSIAYQSKN